VERFGAADSRGTLAEMFPDFSTPFLTVAASPPVTTATTTVTSTTQGGSGANAILVGVITGVVVALITGVVAWLLTRGKRTQDAEVATRIGNLEEMFRTLSDEAQARRPSLSVALVAGGDPETHVIVTRYKPPEVDVEAIVASERAAALATLQPIADNPTAASGDMAAAREVGGMLAAVASLYTFARAFGPQFLPVTQADHDEFAKRVESYAAELRAFIPRWIGYLEAKLTVITLEAFLKNVGGAPAEDARTVLHFPDPCGAAQTPPDPHGPPGRPRFKPRKNPDRPFRGLSDLSGLQLHTPTPYRYELPNIHINRNGPFYESGSLNVRFDYTVRQHDPVTTDSFVVGVPGPDVFDVGWRITAKNLPRPEEGVVTLDVRHEEAAVAPVSTLDALLALDDDELELDED
jgi:hypothetical protein